MTGAARRVLLVNPNTSTATTAMMLEAAAPHLPPGSVLRGTQAERGPRMIVDGAALADSAAEVVRIGMAEAGGVDAVVVAAFGDPGVPALRASLSIPVVGIGEAACREASEAGRFGIATTTPGLLASIEDMVQALGLWPGFTGVRLAEGDPLALAADPARQADALAEAAAACLEIDGAATVVIGGGPLSGAAASLQQRFGMRLVAPVPAAMRDVARMLGRAAA